MVNFKAFFSFMLLFILASCASPPEGDQTQTASTPQSTNPVEDATEYYENGTVKLKGNTIGGKRVGKWEAFYPNGYKWSETNYSNGLKDGPVMSYFQNGIMRYQGKFAQDKRASTWQFYDSTGVLIRQMDMDSLSAVDQNPK